MDELESIRKRRRILDRTGIGEPAKDGSFARYSTYNLVIALNAHLGELSARAVQNPEAAFWLWTFAGTACSDLWEVCERKPENIRPCAAKKLTFPVRWPLHKKRQPRVTAMMKTIGMGTESQYRVGKKQFDPDVVVNALVLGWAEYFHKMKREVQLEFAAHYRAHISSGNTPLESIEDFVAKGSERLSDPWLRQAMALPELTQASADIWATAIWKSVLRTSNGKPEDNPDLRKIGEYRKRHSEHIGQQKKVTQKTEKANIRDGIRDRIFKAVRAIAR